MLVIGVLDLLGGRAVHARGGRRSTYAPVRAAAGVPIEGDARSLARTYRDVLGVRELYAADLDAIQGGVPQRTLVAELTALGVPLWLDAGVADAEGAWAARALGAAHVVVGLETLGGRDALAQICAAVGGAHVAFSLDLRDGVPLLAPGLAAALTSDEASPDVLATCAADTGVGAIIVLDLARVGTGVGVDLALLRQVRAAAPAVMLLAGGGVRGPEDLSQLTEAGCDGALVASALHDGRLGFSEARSA